MSYHPDNEPGFEMNDCCPYCGSCDFDWSDLIEERSGIVQNYNVYRAVCSDCRKAFKVVTIVCENIYGTIKTEEDEEEE